MITQLGKNKCGSFQPSCSNFKILSTAWLLRKPVRATEKNTHILSAPHGTYSSPDIKIFLPL